MARKLLFRKLKRTLHIALFVLLSLTSIKVSAQSVFLPGDVVIVSANADTQSIDFIPLIDVEKGTTLYFANGIWDDSTHTLTGQELHLTFNEPVQAGTNIHVNNLTDPRISVSGEINFDGTTHRLFAYQKENTKYRFVFGVGWGKKTPWRNAKGSEKSSDIPTSLKENTNTLLTLGEASNYQYYIRNGASGTRKLLLEFVGDEANWRGSDKMPFPAFGTSFKLVAPPVVLFDQSVSTISEKDSVAILDVAIYDHDGSRLSVDVMFDSLHSLASPDNFNGFHSKKLNFTGLVGDGVYEVRVPIKDNKAYNGIKTGIFTLANLSKGNYGDFLSHSLIIKDDELPDVLISKVINKPEDAGIIEIENREKTEIPLNGWSLTSNDQRYIFPDHAFLSPGESLKWVDQNNKKTNINDKNTVYSSLKKPLLNTNGGNLVLRNYDNTVISEVVYAKLKRGENKEERREDLIISSDVVDHSQDELLVANGINTQASILQTKTPGWKVLRAYNELIEEFPETEFYLWDEEQQALEKYDGNAVSGTADEPVIFGYFKANEVDKLVDWAQNNIPGNNSESNLIFKVSATDRNQNETLDGLEGLNLAFNNLDTPISVQSILELASEKYPDIMFSPAIYGVKQKASGSLDFIKFEEEDVIAPKASFWVMLESIHPFTEISLSKDELLDWNNSNIDENVENAEEGGVVEFKLSAEGDEEVLKLYINDGANTIKTRDLNSYPGLFFQDKSFVNMAFSQGEDYYNSLTLSSDVENKVSIPVYFSTSSGGQVTLSITNWENIPTDWEIKLEDKLTDKEHNLRKDFSLTFEHLLSLRDEEEDGTEDYFLSQEGYVQTDRFVLHIIPANELGVETETDIPRELELYQNFPNPFNPVTTISFYLPEAEDVRLSVFNVVGQPVAVLAQGRLSTGVHEFDWDATDKPSGMYIYQLEVGKNVMTRKMTLVK